MTTQTWAPAWRDEHSEAIREIERAETVLEVAREDEPAFEAFLEEFRRLREASTRSTTGAVT